MMWRLFLCLCLSVVSAAQAQITFEEAGEAARQVEIPNFADLITQDKINETLPPTSFGDTSGLSNLRGDNGMGDIKTPGLNKAIACDTKNDPECLAIQMLRYGSANNPKFDESTEAQIKGEYSTIIGNKEGVLGDLANLGSKERVCETVESVIPGQSATEVCDITTATGSTEGTCEEGWEESKSLLVYYQCTMKALQTENRCDVTTTAITHNEDIYQCMDRSAVIENNACTVTTMAITHDQDIYECIDRKDVFEDNACTVTTTAITHDQDIYQCTDRKDVFEDKHCAVTTTAITHKEDIYQCTDRAATYENRTCNVPATVVVEKTYPYTCPITLAQETKTSCVKTLDVVVTPLCSTKDPATASISLREYRTLYGWRPNSAYYTLSAVLACQASLNSLSIAVQNGSTTVTTVTSLPATINANLKGLDVVIRLWEVEYNHQRALMMDVTNVDTGQGSTTLTLEAPMPLEKDTQTEYDVWSETCEGGTLSANASCTVTSRTCLQGQASKTINGYVVTRDCWQWKEERTCTDGQSVDHCTTLANESGCTVEKEECLSMNAAGVCAKTQITYACDHAVTGLPSDNVALDVRVKINTTFDKEGACATLIADASCTEKSHYCTETAGTKQVDGVDVTLSCWAEQYSYSCKTADESLTCQLLGGAGCTLQKEVSETTSVSVDQYACVQGKSGPIPTHEDIRFIETVTITDGYQTNDAACQLYANDKACTLSTSVCSDPLTQSVCGTENRTYVCQTGTESLTCSLLGGVGCTHYKDVSDTTDASVDQYACVHGDTTGPIPSHADITFVETQTITDGYKTDDSACEVYAKDATCSLSGTTCGNPLTESICGAENRTYTCQTGTESLTCHLLGGVGCTHYKDVSDTVASSIDQYACVHGGTTGAIPTHEDIRFVETQTVTDGYKTDDSACKPFAESQVCSLVSSNCSNQLTDTLCGAEDRTYTCQTTPESLTCTLLGGAGCSLYKEVSQTTATTVNQYACVQGATGPIPSHDDIQFVETLIVTDGYKTDDSACKAFMDAKACSLSESVCGDRLTDTVCGTENRTYTCTGELDSGACTVLEDNACTAEGERCVETIGDLCLSATQDWTCKSTLSSLPSHIKETGREEVIDSISHVSDCPAFASSYAFRAAPACREVARTCSEGAATKVVNGQSVYKDCWHYEVTYECAGQGETINGCERWETNDTCELVTEECLASNGTECTYTTRTYKCKETPDQVIRQEKCTESVCAYGFCETRDDDANTGLYDSILKMEIARQAAVYGEYDDVSFFKGELNTCENKQGQNCCAGKVKGNQSNQAGLGAAYVFGMDATMEAIKTVGSPYVYDILSSHESLEPLLNKLYGQAANGAYSPSLSYYGVTVSYTGGSMALSFNPYVFFATVAIEVATQYFSCEPEEQALQLKKGQNLCVYLGSRCTQYNMGSCLIKEEQYCCYNSRLARVVQEAAKAQHGDRGLEPCRGMTPYEFMTLDFSKIDLSGILSDIASQQLAEIDANRTIVQTGERIESLKNATDKYEPMDTKTGVVGQ